MIRKVFGSVCFSDLVHTLHYMLANFSHFESSAPWAWVSVGCLWGVVASRLVSHHLGGLCTYLHIYHLPAVLATPLCGTLVHTPPISSKEFGCLGLLFSRMSYPGPIREQTFVPHCKTGAARRGVAYRGPIRNSEFARADPSPASAV